MANTPLNSLTFPDLSDTYIIPPGEQTPNLFVLSDGTASSVALTFGEDGTITLNGTASATGNFVFAGTLPAGTYSAKMYLGLGGTISDDTKISLRTRTSAISETTATSNTTRWLNSANLEALATVYSDPVYVCITVTSGTVLTNYKIRVQIESGSTLGGYTPPGKTAIDYVARANGGGSPYTSNPAALGTASAGSSDAYSRGDHVHPMPSASDVGAIAAPSSPSSGQYLSWNGSAWVATSLPVYNGGVS